MSPRRKLPAREHVFVLSLQYHGFRVVHRRQGLKWREGYIIPATKLEDSSGTDFMVKMPRAETIVPVQVTQRGTSLYKKHSRPTPHQLIEFSKASEKRIRAKRKLCSKHAIAFVLVRDHDGMRTNTTLAWGDVKALRYAIAQMGCYAL